MTCPKCQTTVKVIDTLQNEFTNETYRRKKCPECGFIFHTVERSRNFDRHFQFVWNECWRRSRKKKDAMDVELKKTPEKSWTGLTTILEQFYVSKGLSKDDAKKLAKRSKAIFEDLAKM